MPVSSDPVSSDPVSSDMAMPPRRLAARLYAYLFLNDFVLLYPVYALLFEDSGLSTAQISSLFVIWAITGILAEIPSAVWADLTSRRLLLVVGPLLSATGFALWVAVPSYLSFAAGFVLWGVSGALHSGALEALVYEELDRAGASSRYPTIMGRGRAAATAAVGVGTALAAPAFAVGGFGAVGLASVLAGLACAAVGATLPEGRGLAGVGSSDEPAAGAGAQDGGEPVGYRGFVTMLRAGVSEIRAHPRVRSAVLVVPAVTAIWGSLEEYTPLLAAGTGVAVAAVPLLLLLLDAGTVSGGLLGGLSVRRSTLGLAGLLVFAAAAMAAGALTGHPAGFVLLAVAFGVFQFVTVAADARLQDVISGPARSTVTSVAGLGTGTVTIAVYASYAVGSRAFDHATLFAVASLGYLGVAVTLVLAGLNRREAADLWNESRSPGNDARPGGG